MKNITELSEQEILALTSEELETMVKYQMAEKGVKILQKPTEPYYEPMPEKTEVVFNVQGFNYVFKDEEIARKLSKAIHQIKLDLYNTTYNNSYNLKYVKEIDEYSLTGVGNVTQEVLYSKESIDLADEIKKRNDAVKSEYTELLTDYNVAKEDSSEIRDAIYEVFYAVQKKYYDFNVITERYSEYLSIANGDKDIAMKFLKKAYLVSDEAEDYIIANQKQEAIKPPAKASEETSSDDLPNFL